MVFRLIFGLVLSAAIGALAYRRGSLSRSGIAGAILTGTAIFGFAGWTAGLLLIAFFVSSSLLSHFKQTDRTKARAAEAFEKGGRRDIWQALANGGAAALAALAFALLGSGQSILAYAGLLGALATVNADTWATELGVLSRRKPRLITSFKTVEPGTSGGLSMLGLAAAAVGSLFIWGVFFVIGALLQLDGPALLGGPGGLAGLALRLLPGAVVGGVLGSLADSLLGATVQAIYWSEARQKETEKTFERDGTPNRPLRGWAWMNNDWVNFLSSLVGALLSTLLMTVFIPIR